MIGVLFFLVMSITYTVENKLNVSADENSWIISLLITISAFCQQGTSIVPYYSVGRLVLLNLMLFAVLLYNYYTSSIVSSLLSEPPETLKTIMDLAKSKLAIGIENLVYVNTLFEVIFFNLNFLE